MHAPRHGKCELNALPYSSEMLYERHHGILKAKLKVIEPKFRTNCVCYFCSYNKVTSMAIFIKVINFNLNFKFQTKLQLTGWKRVFSTLKKLIVLSRLSLLLGQKTFQPKKVLWALGLLYIT